MTHEQLMQLKSMLLKKGYDESMITLYISAKDMQELADFEKSCYRAVSEDYVPKVGDEGYVQGCRYIVVDWEPSRYVVWLKRGKYILEEGFIC